MSPADSKPQLATLGGGCFWCVEAMYERIGGILDATSGYAGGSTPNPTYDQVCSGTTGHAEVVQLRFDPDIVSFKKIIDLFWKFHDPTTLNRQGADVGTQYRSIILTQAPEQEEIARSSMQSASQRAGVAFVTEISPLKHFYPAEKYHQDYYRRNSGAPYCRAVILPKLERHASG